MEKEIRIGKEEVDDEEEGGVVKDGDNADGKSPLESVGEEGNEEGNEEASPAARPALVHLQPTQMLAQPTLQQAAPAPVLQQAEKPVLQQQLNQADYVSS